MKKYICWGGDVVSRSDGDRHFIGARRLAQLYSVSPAECIFIDPSDRPVDVLRGLSAETIDSLIDLYPSETGDYPTHPINKLEKD